MTKDPNGDKQKRRAGARHITPGTDWERLDSIEGRRNLGLRSKQSAIALLSEPKGVCQSERKRASAFVRQCAAGLLVSVT